MTFTRIIKVLIVILSALYVQINFESESLASDDASNLLEYSKGIVVSITNEGMVDLGGISAPYQELLVRFEDGHSQGNTVSVKYGTSFSINESQKVKVGDRVVVSRAFSSGAAEYFIADRYRIDNLLLGLILFVVLVVIFARFKGITSVFGLIFSVLVITYYIVPKLVSGENPILIVATGTVLIGVVSLYLAHGVSIRTTLSLVSILVTMIIAVLIAILSVSTLKLTGSGSEEAFFLQLSSQKISLQGLLLGGIIMGVLGVLDDITTAQTAVVYELKRANPKLTWVELYKRGIFVGTEHITSLINTLFLAYAGASLPLFLLFTVHSDKPVWVTINSEFVMEEIVRSLIGSASLVIAVPISTLIAAYYFKDSES